MVYASKFHGVNLYSERHNDLSTNSSGLRKGFCSTRHGDLMCGNIAWLAVYPGYGACPSCQWHPPHLLPTARIDLAFLTHPSLHLLFILEPHMAFLIPHVHSHSCDLSSLPHSCSIIQIHY